jgi:hypothetical protein
MQFVADDDAQAKATVLALVEQLGFEVLNAGAQGGQAPGAFRDGLDRSGDALQDGYDRAWAFVNPHRTTE